MVLDVREGNERAVRCYTGFGFAPTGRRRSGGRLGETSEIQYAYPLTDRTGFVGARG